MTAAIRRSEASNEVISYRLVDAPGAGQGDCISHVDGGSVDREMRRQSKSSWDILVTVASVALSERWTSKAQPQKQNRESRFVRRKQRGH